MDRTSKQQRDGKNQDLGRRTEVRLPVMIPATVIMPEGEAVCVIRDLSRSGARLSISQRYQLATTFSLRIPKFPHLFPMRRIWRAGNLVGARLNLPAAEAGAPAPTLDTGGPATSPSPPAHPPCAEERGP